MVHDHDCISGCVCWVMHFHPLGLLFFYFILLLLYCVHLPFVAILYFVFFCCVVLCHRDVFAFLTGTPKHVVNYHLKLNPFAVKMLGKLCNCTVIKWIWINLIRLHQHLSPLFHLSLSNLLVIICSIYPLYLFLFFCCMCVVINRSFDISAAKSDLHYSPLIEFQEGWHQTIDWFKLNWLPRYLSMNNLDPSSKLLLSSSSADSNTNTNESSPLNR